MSHADTIDPLREGLLEQVGLPFGGSGPMLSPDPVNTPMIRHWVDALDDRNPIYLDDEAARRAGHEGAVAPPAMLQTWTMGRPKIEGIAARGGSASEIQGENPITTLAGAGFTGERLASLASVGRGASVRGARRIDRRATDEEARSVIGLQFDAIGRDADRARDPSLEVGAADAVGAIGAHRAVLLDHQQAAVARLDGLACLERADDLGRTIEFGRRRRQVEDDRDRDQLGRHQSDDHQPQGLHEQRRAAPKHRHGVRTTLAVNM